MPIGKDQNTGLVRRHHGTNASGLTVGEGNSVGLRKPTGWPSVVHGPPALLDHPQRYLHHKPRPQDARVLEEAFELERSLQIEAQSVHLEKDP
jgi:hypothetical protein